VRVRGCELRPAGRLLERRIDGVYAALRLQGNCRPGAEPIICYALFAGVDPTHRGIARIEWAGAAPTLQVLAPASGTPGSIASAGVGSTAGDTPKMRAASDPAASLQFLREGTRHILGGYDHVLFLLCLLLPAVMRRTGQGWQPVERLSEAVWPVAGIVTAFTVAHSITLALAATGVASLPPWFIEPAIAVTIILAALDNFRPIFRGRRGIVTFGFGLIHGFGFAGVLAELNLLPAQFAWALLQFNIGLELGGLLIVVVATSLLFLMRRRAGYPVFFIRGGSTAAMAVGGLLLVERTIDVLPL
jgi:hypothetical protein